MRPCRDCNVEITFCQSHAGKWQPMNADGSAHVCRIELSPADTVKSKARELERAADRILARAGPASPRINDDAIQQNIRKVPCPVCHAKVGERCVSSSGKERSKYHSARRVAARLALLPAPLAARAALPVGASA